MTRHYNFCAGPAALPDAVLARAQREMLDFEGRGLSVMEMSHRSDEFVGIAKKAEATLRRLMGIPEQYRVLFLQGGASMQFAMLPMNLLGRGGRANFIQTGIWGKKALAEARHLGFDCHVAGESESNGHVEVPARESLQVSDDAAYLHYTANETIGGLEFDYVPTLARADGADVPLVCDMSSSILSGPIDVTDFGVIYAGAQKNIGPAGLTLVIVREDLIGHALARTPTLFDYQALAEAESMVNTPPTYAWYLSGLVFDWLENEMGGLSAIDALNQRKADKLYRAIDDSDFYSNPIARHNRSRMNVPFVLADSALDKAFLSEAEAAGLLNLKGHRSVGGMRASLYNAVPEAAVDALIAFMHDFEQRKG
ncbi:3-phosphoserine/phosphohydroxythreonine transaminase [Halomonas sp. 707D7]|uniref:3-phosphoserine/phosphohydroxythreonine transaminase n=3 Tax=unclassified Halomonas TaxID=2609666 RepID=UPI0020A0D0FB|nr:3-phosphoserine/phosphohydroxythreonine transaminase [Halomonas sp. 707D7]MCP1315434.1 3-phosphoserine/phosphohydroxythreonine transaminase [Halomonas sp. 707D7]